MQKQLAHNFAHRSAAIHFTNFLIEDIHYKRQLFIASLLLQEDLFAMYYLPYL